MPIESLLMTEENIKDKRAEAEQFNEYFLELDKEHYKVIDDVNITNEEITVNDGATIGMHILRPKALESQSAPAYIYAHWGGGVCGSAKDLNPQMAITALNLDCVVFNVDYRLAPEAKAPRGQQDFVDATNHIIANA